MDSASQCSVLESVEENELTPESVLHVDGDATSSNCSGCHKNENLKPDSESATLAAVDKNPPDLSAEKNFKAGESVHSPPTVSPPTTKGYGLKKWRRIRRDIQKDSSATADSNKVMKRVLPFPTSPNKTFHSSKPLVGPTSGMRYDGMADGSAAPGSSSSSRFAAATTFAAGADSDNSEDRSSKSSTAASVPKFRFELPSGSRYAPEKTRIKNVSGKNLSGSAKGSQQGKGRVESSKKQRGERIKIEKEKSHSSGESESRSSKFVFKQTNFSVTRNGNNSGNCDGECSDDAEENKPQFSEEVQNGYSKQNSGVSDDYSQDASAAGVPWKVRKENHENRHSSADRDPLVDSVLSLQTVQESLERELQKLSDISKEPLSPPSANGTSPYHDQLEQVQFNHISRSFLEIQVLNLTENVKNLETNLEEANASLQMKDAHLSDLKAALSLSKLPKEEPGSREVESELEGIFRQKIEAEIEYFVITRALQKLRVEEQQSLAEVQSKMTSKLVKVEAKAALLKKQAEEESDYLVSADIRGLDEVLRFQKRTCTASFYLILQLVLLLAVCLQFASRLSSKSAVSLPT